MNKQVAVCLLAALCWSCGSSSDKADATAPKTEAAVALDTPLKSYASKISSSATEVTGKPGDTVDIPVTVTNNGQETWGKTGKFPVDLSYKFFANGAVLPIEGARTELPRPLKPGESVDVKIHVILPPKTDNLVVKFTPVQEAQAWFLGTGGTSLDLPVHFN